MPHLDAELVQSRDEHVFQKRFVPPNLVDLQAMRCEALADCHLGQLWLTDQHVETVAESLHVEHVLVLVAHGRQHLFGHRPTDVRTSSRRGAKAAAEFGRRADLVNFASVHQRHAMAAFGFVEVGRGDQNRQAVGRQVRERIPEFAARHRIDAGRRLVEQQHPRLGHERTRQSELLLHAAAQPAGQPVGEAIQIEHPQVAEAAPLDLVARHAAQVADVAQVLGDGEVGIQTERLRQVPGVRACVSRPAGRRSSATPDVASMTPARI